MGTKTKANMIGGIFPTKRNKTSLKSQSMQEDQITSLVSTTITMRDIPLHTMEILITTHTTSMTMKHLTLHSKVTGLHTTMTTGPIMIMIIISYNESRVKDP